MLSAGDDLMAAAPLLEVKGLSVELQRGSERRPVLGEVGFACRRPEVVGVIGESGSGKTTLAKAVVGWIQPPLVRTQWPGPVRGPRPFAMPEAERLARAAGTAAYRRRPRSSFDPTIPVGMQIVGEAARGRPEIGAEGREKARVALLDRVISRPPHAGMTSSRTSIRAGCCSGR